MNVRGKNLFRTKVGAEWFLWPSTSHTRTATRRHPSRGGGDIDDDERCGRLDGISDFNMELEQLVRHLLTLWIP